MRFEDMMFDVNVLVTQALTEAQEVSPEQLGLDRRACWANMKVTDEFIAVPMAQDRTMRYYGGFEYVTEGVMTIGEMKVYFADGNTRVQNVLDRFNKE